jgi:hypothetical protein
VGQELLFSRCLFDLSFESVYAIDTGGGAKRVPVIYFPDDACVAFATLANLDFLFYDPSYWFSLGGLGGFMTFSVDEKNGEPLNNTALFLLTGRGGLAFLELPRNVGGFILPIVSVQAFIQGTELYTMPGGFNQTILNWNEDLEFGFSKTLADDILTLIPSMDGVVTLAGARSMKGGAVESSVDFFDVLQNKKTPIGSNDSSNGEESTNGSDNATTTDPPEMNTSDGSATTDAPDGETDDMMTNAPETSESDGETDDTMTDAPETNESSGTAATDAPPEGNEDDSPDSAGVLTGHATMYFVVCNIMWHLW